MSNNIFGCSSSGILWQMIVARLFGNVCTNNVRTEQLLHKYFANMAEKRIKVVTFAIAQRIMRRAPYAIYV